MVDCRGSPPTRSVAHFPSKLYPLLKTFMTVHPNASCTDNCSGHGECHQGICFCEVQYSGGTCTDPNLSYFVAFSTIFYLICAVSFVQLLVCIRSEFSRIKPPSLLKAFKVTTQKALYALICIATFARGFYFSSPENASLEWASSLMSAYYPLLLTGSSLIVCFWAEVFHLRDLRHDKPRFLSKSFLGFLAFNIITYSLLLAELVLTQFAGYGETERSLFLGVFNGSFAVLMVIVVVFFLIYGVEVYFKVRGAFVAGPPNTAQHVASAPVTTRTCRLCHPSADNGFVHFL
ncbi:hypothetical protein MTO96_031734 [Rhipicephalus appendiculatus]